MVWYAKVLDCGRNYFSIIGWIKNEKISWYGMAQGKGKIVGYENIVWYEKVGWYAHGMARGEG